MSTPRIARIGLSFSIFRHLSNLHASFGHIPMHPSKFAHVVNISEIFMKLHLLDFVSTPQLLFFPVNSYRPRKAQSRRLPSQRMAEVRRASRSHASRRTRRVVASFWQNFGKMLLVFGCIGTDLCKKICVLQHFSKSTRLSS